MSARCGTILPTATLIAYWLGELAPAEEAEVEEHAFGCAECSDRLHWLVQARRGIRHAISDGSVHAVFAAPFVRRMQEGGLSVREYRLQPGGSVMCTIAPQDDLVVAHLHAPLRDVQRLDIMYHDVTAGIRAHMPDVAFDPAADEIVMLSNSIALRQLGAVTHRVQLLAVEDGTERLIGEYTFNHSPYQAGR